MKKRIEDIFDNTQAVPVRVLVFWAVLWVAFFFVYRFTTVNYDLEKTVFGFSNDLKFVTSTILSLTTNIFAGLLFAYFYKVKESDRLRMLRNVALPEFTQELLTDVAHYRGTYCKEHNVDAKLRIHESRSDLLTCELTYSYRKSKIGKEVKATFYRIADETNTDDLPIIADECHFNEFVWYNDERDMGERPLSNSYVVSDLCIGNIKYKMNRVENGDDRISYFIELKEEPAELSFITYKVSFPVERESIITITAEFPTKSASFSFDYKELARDITVSVLPKTGIKSNPISTNKDDGFLRFRHDGWMLPKDGYTISWWTLRHE